jgi:formylglycine-generating enzyme required for sulfatase activity
MCSQARRRFSVGDGTLIIRMLSDSPDGARRGSPGWLSAFLPRAALSSFLAVFIGGIVWAMWPDPATAGPLTRAKLALPSTARLRSRCAENMVLVEGSFCIDRYEASTESLDANGKVLGPHTPYEMHKHERVRAVSRAGVHPQAHVTLEQARAACANAGKRLCTDGEWMQACRGPQLTKFPYGKTYDKTACNDRASSPFWKLFGSEPPAAVLASPIALNNPKLNQQGGLAKTGAFKRCVTSYGAYDMVGNLHEWTSDPAGTFRGGYYRDAREHGPGCLYVTKGHDAHYRDYSTGFRCCAAPL